MTTKTSPALDTELPVHGLGHAEFVVLMSAITATIAISIDTVLPAFDEIEAEFGLNPNDSPVSMTITIFLASMGIGMLSWGPLADRFGRKPIMYSSMALFLVGALISTFASSFAMFLIGRVVWGVAAAGPRTVSLAITRDSYSGDLMARIMSLTSAVFLLVPVLAPALGEGLIHLGSWRYTTAAAAVLAVVSMVWFTKMRETLPEDGALPLEFGRIARAARAVVSNRTTLLLMLASTMGYGAFFPWLGSSTQMIGTIYGRSSEFALIFGFNAVLMAVTIVSVERLVNRYSTFPVLFVQSILIVIVGAIYVIWAVQSNGVIPFWTWFALASVLTGLNSGSTPLMQTMAMEPMGAMAGTASSVTGATIFIGGAFIGSLIDARIVDTVTAFGAGFLILGVIGAVLTWFGRPAASEPAVS